MVLDRDSRVKEGGTAAVQAGRKTVLEHGFESGNPFPLTPALSDREREASGSAVWPVPKPCAARMRSAPPEAVPLAFLSLGRGPGGGGRSRPQRIRVQT